MEYFRAESGGPWFPASVMAASILGYRAVKAGQMGFSDVQGQLALRFPAVLHGKHPPSAEIIRQWAEREPGYTERVLRDGLVRRDQLPPWALRHVLLEPPTLFGSAPG